MASSLSPGLSGPYGFFSAKHTFLRKDLCSAETGTCTYILCERLCSLYMETHLQPVPQVEAPGQGNEPFSQADWGGFNLLSMQCPGGRSLTELSLWLLQFGGEGRNANPSGHKDQAIKGPP